MSTFTDKNTVIGIWNDYDDTREINVEELGEMIKYGTDVVYNSSQFCDRRCSTNLTRFNFDPYTGDKIDWKVVYKILCEYERF